MSTLVLAPPRGGSWAWMPGMLAALVITALFTLASYPGFMSFDSIEALRQARFQVEGSQYPPFGSYVWRVFDWIWPGPTLMQLFQNGVLLGAFACILYLLGWPPLLQMVAVLAVALLPPITGTMLVVWKDVAVAAFYMAGFGVLFWVRQRDPARRNPLLAFAVLLVFCGMAYRFNAASGAFPLLVYATWLALRGDRVPGKWPAAAVSGTVLLFSLFALVWGVNSFRFPALERLERNTNIDSIMRFDLVGISRYSGESVVPGRDGAPVDLDYLRKIYDARHLNITGMNDVEKRVATQQPGEIKASWWKAVTGHPLAYMRHRAEVMREYMALHNHDVFYVTHPSVDENKLGVSHQPTELTRLAVGHVWKLRNSMLNRAWVYYLLGIAAVAYALRRSPYRSEAVTILASGLLYLAPMYFITPAGDVRYNFWSIWTALVCILMVTAGVFRGRGNNAHSA